MVNTVNFFVNTALDTTGVRVSGAQAYFYESGTTTPVTVFSDMAATVPHDVPVTADGDGVFPPIYIGASTPLKIEVKTPGGVMVGGYPVDPVVPIAGSVTGAATVSFSPTTDIPVTNVQDAVVRVAELQQERILGTVSEASGVPTGDLFENGTNANGDYSRLANGAQTCWVSNRTLTYGGADYLEFVWTFPKAFTGNTTTITSLGGAAVLTGVTRQDLGLWTASNTNTQTTVRLWRTFGAPAFEAGDSVTWCNILAQGRWFL